MTQKEEIYARQFYQELKNEFRGKQNPISKFLGLTAIEHKQDFSIVLKEAGTQSECVITNDARQCSIHCFSNDRNDVKHKGPLFYTTYSENGKPIATGRTFDKHKAIEAIKKWMQNKTLDELYAGFDFIDKEKRQLEKLRTEIIKSSPQLATISQNEVKNEYFSSYSLWFKNDNRCCSIDYNGNKPNPRYIFKWDECAIFETSGSDTKRLATLINKWVFDKAMPSALREEFSEIDFGELAAYYEKGNGIEGEFLLSWNHIENFYRDIEIAHEILPFIQEMRNHGFDRTLRAGQSLYTLILSRARRHGLRHHQEYVYFSFNINDLAMVIRTRNGEKYEFNRIAYNNTIEKLLRKMERENID